MALDILNLYDQSLTGTGEALDIFKIDSGFQHVHILVLTYFNYRHSMATGSFKGKATLLKCLTWIAKIARYLKADTCSKPSCFFDTSISI